MNIELILALWVNNKVVDLVAFNLLVLDQEVVDNVHVTLADHYSPNVNLTVTVSNKESTLIVKDQGIRVLFLEQILVTLSKLVLLGIFLALGW